MFKMLLLITSIALALPPERGVIPKENAKRIAELRGPVKQLSTNLEEKRKLVPVTDQNERAFTRLDILNGRFGFFDSYVSTNAIGNMDIEAVAFLVLMQATQDAEEDLREILREMKASNESKKALREVINRAKEDMNRLEQKLRSEYSSLRFGQNSKVFQGLRDNRIVFTTANQSAALLVDANNGGTVSATVSCPGALKLTARNIFTKTVVGEGQGFGGARLVLQLPTQRPAPIILELATPQARPWQFQECQVELIYDRKLENGLKQLDPNQLATLKRGSQELRNQLTTLNRQILSMLNKPEVKGNEDVLSDVLNHSAAQVNSVSELMVGDLRSIQDDLKGKLDGMNEMSEMTSLRLQMAMDRRSKFMSTLSNIMKKISTTQDTLVQNLK